MADTDPPSLSRDAVRSFLHVVPTMLFGATPEGANVWLSDDWCRYTGRSVDAGLGWNWLDLTHEDDRAAARARWESGTPQESPIEFSQRIRRHDGVYRWFLVRIACERDAAGAVTGWVGSLNDVDDLVRTREALRISEERLRQAARVAGFGVFERDIDNDEVYWSPEMRTIHAWGDQPLPGLREMEQLVHPDDRAAYRAALREGHSPQGTGVFDNEYRIVLPDGSTRWVMSKARTLFEERGGKRVPTRVIGAKLDLTERRHAQLALERANAELHALSRSLLQAHERERARIARELHDELGQALIGINLLIQGVNRASDPIGAVERAVDALAEVVDRTRRICVDLRPPELEELGLVPALRNLVQSVAGRSRIAIRLDAHDQLPAPDPDTATACFRIVQEALTNIERHADAAIVEVSVRADERRIALRVSDDGRGFVASGSGRPLDSPGMGLLGMRERVSILGGELAIRSTPRSGTVIEASLPRSPAIPVAG